MPGLPCRNLYAQVFALCLLLYTGVVRAESPSQQQLAQEARTRIQAFAAELQQTLKTSLTAGGPAAALASCHVAAPALADSHSSAQWSLGRTALRVRNPGNAPDDWERQVLEEFRQKIAAGTPATELEASSLADGRFRYMKPIVTQAVCLPCHGTAINPSLRQQIHDLYPDDTATGFSVGELRGAFTLTAQSRR